MGKWWSVRRNKLHFDCFSPQERERFQSLKLPGMRPSHKNRYTPRSIWTEGYEVYLIEREIDIEILDFSVVNKNINFAFLRSINEILVYCRNWCRLFFLKSSWTCDISQYKYWYERLMKFFFFREIDTIISGNFMTNMQNIVTSQLCNFMIFMIQSVSLPV